MHRMLFVSLLSACAAACATHITRVPHAPPPEVQLKLANLSRIWVAGFAIERKPEFDLNTETVRLLRLQLRTWSSAQVLEVEPLAIDTEERLSEVAFWRRLGEEHGWPLIVTGSVNLHLAPPKIEQHGKRTMYFPSAGRVLEATVVLIDGHNGEVISTNRLPSRMRYGLGRFGSPLLLYLQMMDQAMPDWFKAITETSTSMRRKADPL